MLSIVGPASVLLTLIFAPQAGAYTRTVATYGGGFGSAAGSTELGGGIAFDADHSHYFVADTANNRVSEFTVAGEFVRAWGWGVRDGAAELQTCTAETGCIAGQFGPQAGELNEPSAVAVAPDGTVYVVNRKRFDGRVEAFDTSGAEVAYAGALPAGYGRTGAGEASFNYPLPYSNDISVDSAGRVYVADNAEAGPRIVVFDPKTSEFTFIQVPQLSSIVAFTVAPDGRIWATDNGGTVLILSSAGVEVRQFTTLHAFGALAVQPDSERVLAARSDYKDGTEDGEIELFEYDEAGSQLSNATVTGLTKGTGEPRPYGLAIDPTLEFPESEPGAIFFVDRYGGLVHVLAEATPGRFLLEGSASEEVGPEGATVLATVNPNGNDTRVYFEYGATPAYGFTSPAPPGFDLGNGFSPRTVLAHLTGLAPDTTYHYAVVATGAAGTEVGPDATFTTFAFGTPFSLPDGRAYEQVSSDKGPAAVGGVFAAPAGGGVVLVSSRALPGASTGGLESFYSALRGPEGWRREAATVPVEEAASSTALFVSPDLGETVGSSTQALTPDAPAAGTKLYLRDNAGGGETLMTPIPAQVGDFARYGISADLRHILFESEARLTPDTPEGASRSLYDYSGGTLENVGILPGATVPTTALIGRLYDYYRPSYPVSEDGSKVFFTAEPASGGAEALFMRIDGDRTVEISASQAAAEDPEGAGQPAKFLGASADGSVAFFTSSARLTDDADTGADPGTGEPVDRAANLYRYEVATGRLTDLTVAGEPADLESGAAVGNAVFSADGNCAYFVARGVLAPGATSGEPNLYRWTQASGVRFIARLNGSDLLAREESGFDPAPTDYTRISRDGSVLALTSATALDPKFPEAEGFTPNFETIQEIYRYSAAEGTFACVSCSRTRTDQVPAELSRVPRPSGGYGGNVLSADGSRLFYTVSVPLVAADTNKRNDVYEWEGGSPRLISNGTGGGAGLVDASVSGDDVFFGTDDRLVPGDQDELPDVYDAKVGGGLPGPSAVSPPCEGEGCLPAVEAAPSPGSFGSRSFNGPPNRKAKHHRGKRRHKRKHRKHAKHRKRHRSQGRPAVGKRG